MSTKAQAGAPAMFHVPLSLLAASHTSLLLCKALAGPLNVGIDHGVKGAKRNGSVADEEGCQDLQTVLSAS